MTITCLIRYEIDPFQREAFQRQRERFILREERNFVAAVPGTVHQPPVDRADAP